ncbi:MAG: hypothetical protein ACO35G_10095 [Vulcanococcus sp.]
MPTRTITRADWNAGRTQHLSWFAPGPQGQRSPDVTGWPSQVLGDRPEAINLQGVHGGFRAVNGGYKQSYGVVDPQSEAVHLFGGDVDVDRLIVDLHRDGPEQRRRGARFQASSRS